jgi:nucleotide-binding universal stress UspA family protein
MYKKILAPVDGSAMGECTVEHIKEIAKGCNTPEVIFLFVVDIALSGYWGFSEVSPNFEILQQAVEIEKERADNYLKKLVAKVKEDGLNAGGVILEGYPANAIAVYAERNGIDLIIMSTHGRSGVSRFALGSVTDKVIRTVSVPVIVVTPEECKVKI